MDRPPELPLPNGTLSIHTTFFDISLDVEYGSPFRFYNIRMHTRDIIAPERFQFIWKVRGNGAMGGKKERREGGREKEALGAEHGIEEGMLD